MGFTVPTLLSVAFHALPAPDKTPQLTWRRTLGLGKKKIPDPASASCLAWTFCPFFWSPPRESVRTHCSSWPADFTERLIRACAELPKLCEFFHIPFQSGDDDVLRAMRRGYTHARYRNIVDNIRRHMPDASISGDAIVGFPGA